MIVIEPKYEILRPQIENEESRTAILKMIELAARTCYKSEGQITDNSASIMVRNLVKRKHFAMLEHANMTVRFTVDRAVANEMVRHRIASYAQESSRYCNYGNDKFGGQITVIRPFLFSEGSDDFNAWYASCEAAENAYFALLENNNPEWARSVLPMSTKTEIVVTMNMREWRHFFALRAADATGRAHPQMKQVTVPLLKELQIFLPQIFEDISVDGDAHG